MSNICVLGDGNFGSAIAQLIANNGYKVNIWCNNSVIADSINQNNINSVYLPEVKLNKNIKAFTDINEAIDESTFIFVAIPVQFLRSSLKNCRYTLDQVWVSLSKGIESKTFLLPTQIIDDVFANNVKKAVLLGPTFAYDLLNQRLSAANLATSDNVLYESIKKIMQNDFFKIEENKDLIGMQVCAAFKNVIAIACGIAKGKKLSENTQAYIFFNLINELKIFLKSFNANAETIFSLAGIGDIVLTSFGSHSKNFKLGYEVGQGLKFVNKETIPEGLNTIKTLYDFAHKNSLNMPILKKIFEIIFNFSTQDLI